ncbi:MAG: cytochrome c biogenesis protein [Nitrospinaceae bacterium]|nr:MAG: cytochrome c biogenesis protein [Nitrospinaceae bacterium]
MSHQGTGLMKLTECYDTLNVSPDSKWQEIKKAYHFLAKKYHPDVQPKRPGSESKFRRITQAFKLLETRYRMESFEKANGKQTKSPPFSKRQSSPKNQDEPVAAVPLEKTPTLLHTHKKTVPGEKRGFTGNLKHFGQSLFKLEKKVFLLDLKQNIYLKKRLVNKANIVRIKRGKDNFQVRIPPGPWTCMFIRIPNKGNKSLFSNKRGDLLLNITVPEMDFFTPTNPNFYYKVRIPRERLEANKAWILKSTRGPIRFTLPENTEDGQKFTLKSSASKSEPSESSHIITVHLV